MPWTERQREAIEDRGHSLLVSAAAGSGKTAVLVERIRRLAADEGVGLDRMLVVTFTEAAASEMKERIYKSLSDVLKDPATRGEKREAMLAQMSLLPRANISTFHSFALEIIRRYYHVIGLAPQLAICDDERAEVLKRDAMEQLFEERFASGDPSFTDFLDRYASAADNGRVEDLIREYHRVLMSLPDPWKTDDRSPEEVVRPYLELAREDCLRYARRAAGYFAANRDRLAAAGCKKMAETVAEDIAIAEDLAAAFAEGRTGGALDAAFARLAEKPAYPRMAASGAEKDAYAAVKEDCRQLRENGKKCLEDARKYYADVSEALLLEEYALTRPQIAVLFDLTRRFDTFYAEAKTRLGLLDFSDIEHFALRILENEEVCAEYRDRFEHIFVDEYQDSNLVQESLIARIARENNVFTVGDVKQSIYKFRLAEPELFLARYERFRADGRTGRAIDLNCNFRSKKTVIDTVNGLFSSLMTRESCGISYDADAALVGADLPGRPDGEPTSLVLVDLADTEGLDEEIAEMKLSQAEALQALRIVRENHGRMIRDDKLERERPLEYRDMVILMRSTKEAGEIFYKTLLDGGVPVYLERGEGYFDAIEVQVFLNLLRLIDNRRQDVPLLSVLRFPVFGFDAEALAAVRIYSDRTAGRKLAYHDAFALYAGEGPDEALRGRCAAFLAELEDRRTQAAYRPLGDFIWDLLNETGFAAFAAALPGGDQRLANLRTLADRARDYESGRAGGLYGFISYIDVLSRRQKAVQTGQTKIVSENADCVRIMTIHKSKGLEFPLVIVAGVGRRFPAGGRTKIPAAFHKDLGTAIRLVNPKTSLYNDTNLLRIIRRRQRGEDMAETIRILYVAATRPKDRLIFLGSVGAKKDRAAAARLILPGDTLQMNCYLDMILSSLPDLPVQVVNGGDLQDLLTAEEEGQHAMARQLLQGFDTSGLALPVPREELAARILPAAQTAPEGLKRKYSVSELAASAAQAAGGGTAAVSAPQPQQGAPERIRRAPAFLSDEARLGAAERGTAYHSVMEQLPFTPESKSEADIAAFIEKLKEGGILTPQEAQAVRPAQIAAFFASPLARRIYASPEVCKEAPFTMKHRLGDREVLVQGVIDCFFREEDGYVLIDYKSNYVDPLKKEASYADLRAHYLPQLALYREALEKLKGVKVKEAMLYVFATGEFLTV